MFGRYSKSTHFTLQQTPKMTPILKLFLVMCFHAVVVRSEVGTDFSNCPQFFYKGRPPQLQLRQELSQPPKSICQMHENLYHFASLYSTSLRIPLYSAYTLPDPCQGTQPNRKSGWFIEPQVSCLYHLAIPKIGFKRNVEFILTSA